MKKSAKKSKENKEPTLTDVMGSLQDLTGAVQTGFAKVEERFEMNEERLRHIEQRIDTRSKSTNDRIDNIDARLGVLQRGQVKIESHIGDIQDDLASALQATDNDGSAILNHEHRISHLEKLGGIKSVPAKHLVGL